MSGLLLNPVAFRVMIEEADPRLIGFFDIAIIPNTRSAYNREVAKKKIVAICYIMVTQRNLSANKFALNVGLFLDSTGSNNESTDAMHKNWSSIIVILMLCLAFFIRVIHTVFNKDDFHSIKEKRRSNATWLSTGHHMTTCICKQITSCPQIPITYNGASIYNPTNIDRSILDNGKSFLDISQNGSNELTEEEQDNEEQDNEEQEEGIEEMNDSDLTTISFN
ncbi:hypothetical protein RhiirA5_493124 [Rhizophagus irregularis]|uniref:Uncharacterized protein n=1 Tax=Rhizophagus irregularis TaxID=588596 RepID=A0A2N0QDT8_9GLOM|nr:hypothetical protein RhiirA5_493124 [Rhizophagus irregularis]